MPSVRTTYDTTAFARRLEGSQFARVASFQGIPNRPRRAAPVSLLLRDCWTHPNPHIWQARRILYKHRHRKFRPTQRNPIPALGQLDSGIALTITLVLGLGYLSSYLSTSVKLSTLAQKVTCLTRASMHRGCV